MSVTQLNYSQKAIADLSAQADKLNAYPETQASFRKLCKLLDQAEKFIMPNCGDLIDPEKFNEADYALLKLPYPLTVFEAPWITDLQTTTPTGFEILPSPKRIALLIESTHPGIKGLRDHSGTLLSECDGALLISIFLIKDTWRTHYGGFFLPYNVDPSSLGKADATVFERHNEHYVESGMAPPNAQRIEIVPVIIMQDLFDLMVKDVGLDKTLGDMLDNTRDEIMLTLQACAIINCENVQLEELAVPRRLQKSRIKSGKPPLYEYKILDIGEEFYRLPSGNSGGSKAAPRMHKRRGHIRRLDETRTTWVRHAVVNAGAKHSIEKSYAVKSSKT